MRKVIVGLVVAIVVLLFGIIGSMMMRTEPDRPDVAMQTVTDSTGKEVQIPLHPQRVVFLNVSNRMSLLAVKTLSSAVLRRTLYRQN